MNMTNIILRQIEFSKRAFGPGDRPKMLVDHIRKELIEIEAAPQDLSEWIDVAMLAFDGAWRAGHSADEILVAYEAKLTKNEGRDWPDWRTADPDSAIEHDRNGDISDERMGVISEQFWGRFRVTTALPDATQDEMLALADLIIAWGMTFGRKQSPCAVKVSLSAQQREMIVTALRLAARQSDAGREATRSTGNEDLICPSCGEELPLPPGTEDQARRALRAVLIWYGESPIREIQAANAVCGTQFPLRAIEAALSVTAALPKGEK